MYIEPNKHCTGDDTWHLLLNALQTLLLMLHCMSAYFFTTVGATTLSHASSSTLPILWIDHRVMMQELGRAIPYWIELLHLRRCYQLRPTHMPLQLDSFTVASYVTHRARTASTSNSSSTLSLSCITLHHPLWMLLQRTAFLHPAPLVVGLLPSTPSRFDSNDRFILDVLCNWYVDIIACLMWIVYSGFSIVM